MATNTVGTMGTAMDMAIAGKQKAPQLRGFFWIIYGAGYAAFLSQQKSLADDKQLGNKPLGALV